jgi:hypothetical protein
MGLTYRFKLRAPEQTTAKELETFLKTVETEAKQLGFGPTMVLRAKFDSPDRRAFARRLTHGLVVCGEQFKGTELDDDHVWDHDAEAGECRLAPTEGVVLVLTEKAIETVLGFFKYPVALRTVNWTEVKTEVENQWASEDFLKTPDPRFREIVRLFMEGGFVEEEEDDFEQDGSTFVYIPPDASVAKNIISDALRGHLKNLPKRDFLRAYCSIAYLYPGFHTDDCERADGPAEIKTFAAEAWRRAGENQLTDNELYPYQACKAAVIHSRRDAVQDA